MFIHIRPNFVSIKCQNHYPGFDCVTTVRGKRVYILGAPLLFRSPELVGPARDEVVERGTEKNHAKSIELISHLLRCEDAQKWGRYLNGNFLIVVNDQEQGKCSIIVDLGNSYHLYSFISDQQDEIIFCTDLDRLALSAGLENAIDFISIAEYLVQTSVTFPYTFYKHIHEVNYASCLECRYRQRILNLHQETYWLPTSQTQEVSMDIRGLAVRLREAIELSIKERLAGKKNVALFLSGGYDSRIIAEKLAQYGVKATAITISDAHNLETRLAQRVAEANGHTHQLLLRDLEYYPHGIEDSIRLEGPHYNFRWQVYLGFREEIQRQGFDAVFGGYMSDTLLKLHEANVKAKTFLGRHLGTLEEFDPTDTQYLRGGREYLRRFDFLIKPEILEEINHRRSRIMDYWQSLRTDGSAWEWSYMWPFTRNKHNSNLTTNISQFPGYEIYTDRSIIEIASIAHQRIKINGRLFNEATLPLVKNSCNIPIAETMTLPKGCAWGREFKIALRHFVPRKWVFPEPKDLRSKNPAATVLTSSNFEQLWEHSQVLKTLRKEYDPSSIESKIIKPHGSIIFDHKIYQNLSKRLRLHFMYTLVYLNIWYNRRIKFCEDRAESSEESLTEIN